MNCPKCGERVFIQTDQNHEFRLECVMGHSAMMPVEIMEHLGACLDGMEHPVYIVKLNSLDMFSSISKERAEEYIDKAPWDDLTIRKWG